MSVTVSFAIIDWESAQQHVADSSQNERTIEDPATSFYDGVNAYVDFETVAAMIVEQLKGPADKLAKDSLKQIYRKAIIGEEWYEFKSDLRDPNASERQMVVRLSPSTVQKRLEAFQVLDLDALEALANGCGALSQVFMELLKHCHQLYAAAAKHGGGIRVSFAL
jgi:hypothetical protein